MNKKILAVGTATLCLLLASCGNNTSSTADISAQKCTETNGVFNKTTNVCTPDDGDFKLVIEPAKTEDTQKYQTYLETSKAFEPIIEDINADFVLPYDVNIVFTNCDEANAFYSEDTKSLTMCYELMKDVEGIYAESGYEGEELEQVVFRNTLATFFHELGHGMIDFHQMPITGREEDVADQISTYILINSYEGGAGSVLDASEEYYANSAKNELEESSYADTHTLDLARYYNLVCWVYGSDPVEFASLPEETNLPDGRAEGCEDEYLKFKNSLDILFMSFKR